MTFVLVPPPNHRQRSNLRIDPGALTANEASYLSGFRTADELRNRAAKAAEEIDLRLRAKGFQLQAQPAPLSQEGDN
jgi:hypothetical protein